MQQHISLVRAQLASVDSPRCTWDNTVGHWAGTLTDLTVLPGIAPVTTAAIHGAIGATSAPVQARVVPAGIRRICGEDRKYEDGLTTMPFSMESRPRSLSAEAPPAPPDAHWPPCFVIKTSLILSTALQRVGCQLTRPHYTAPPGS